jgi:hypothetical protein
MKAWRWLSCGLALVSLAQAADWRDTLTLPVPGSFPPLRPMKAVYHFGWSGIVAAKAEFDWAKSVPDDLYQLSMNTQTIGFVRTLWRMDSKHVACCFASSLRPIRLDQTEVYKSKTLTTHTDFSDEGARRTTQVTPAKGPPDKEHRFKCPNLFDLESALLFLRSQALKQGDRYRVVVFPSRSAYLADVEVVGREKVKVPAGNYDAIKCRLSLQEVDKHLGLSPHQKFKRAFIWVSDDRDRLVLKIQADIFVGSVWTELESVQFQE